ncbi:MAG: hypothetical protein ACYCZF_18375 [Anaerolineae bacterium]
MKPYLRDRAFIIWLVTLLAGLLLVALPVTADGPNLLQNPGFEQPLAASIPGKENCLIAVPWLAWYVEGPPEMTSQGYLFAPEYKMSTRYDAPFNRVRNGELAQQYFHSFGNFQAGVYQVVQKVTPGAILQLQMWVMAWSCDDESKGNCGNNTSGDPSPMHIRIGIDPTGGTDAFSPNIVWSEEVNAYDAWVLLQVEAVAAKSTVTVFAYSYPDYRSQDNNVYLDDASLIELTPPATNTPVPTDTPVASPTPKATDTSVPTNTPEPTNTPTATATAKPTATRTATATAVATIKPVSSATPQPTRIAEGAASPTAVEKAAPGVSPTPGGAGQSFFARLAAMPGLLVLAGAVVLVILILVLLRKKR